MKCVPVIHSTHVSALFKMQLLRTVQLSTHCGSLSASPGRQCYGTGEPWKVIEKRNGPTLESAGKAGL